MPRVLVAGASGLVGSAALRHFTALPGWHAVGLSRRSVPGAQTLSVDLTDPIATRSAVEDLDEVTHLVYAAAAEAPGLAAGWTDPALMRRNLAMLQHLVEPLLDAEHLQHVSLLQGTKAYGLHHPDVGWNRVRNPLKERDPRNEHPNFYFLQEDWLRERQADAAFGLTVLRPTVVFGDALGNGMNLIPVLGVWGALLRDEGCALDFPGRAVSLQLKEAVDAELVAEALAWSATSPAAAGTFNLTNGDTFRWPDVWPVVADALGLPLGGHRPVRLAEEVPARAAQWASLVDRYALRAPRDVLDVVGQNSLAYADMLLAGGEPEVGPVLNSTIAVRQAGFSACRDTEDMFRDCFRRLQDQGVLPRR